MEKEENLQHVQLPNKEDSEITPKDQLIYLAIKRYMNNETKESFPSLETLSRDTGATPPTIRKILKRLEDFGYIHITKRGRSNVYQFTKYDNFEPFSYDFLDNKNLTFTEKSYLVAAQQHMYTLNDIGKITYSSSELSDKINMPRSTMYKTESSLITKNYLRTLDLAVRDKETGCTNKERLYDLKAYGQAIVCILKNHEERITNNEERTTNNEEEILRLKQRCELLEKDNEIYKRELFKNKEPNNELVL